jgi:hypothetical protein
MYTAQLDDAAYLRSCSGQTFAYRRCAGAMVRLTALAGLLLLTLYWPPGAHAAPTFKRPPRKESSTRLVT